MKMDFRRADAQKLNVILWKDVMGDKPVPAMLRSPVKKSAKDEEGDYSGSTVAVSRSRKAKWLFQQEKATSVEAGKGYTN
jgi:hypothetical protein